MSGERRSGKPRGITPGYRRRNAQRLPAAEQQHNRAQRVAAGEHGDVLADERADDRRHRVVHHQHERLDDYVAVHNEVLVAQVRTPFWQPHEKRRSEALFALGPDLTAGHRHEHGA